MDSLKDCPFCGGALINHRYGSIWFHPGTVTDGTCLLSGKGYYGSDLDAWNARPAPTGDVVRVTNGQVSPSHYSRIGDAARQIASYCEGPARANVYKAALNALSAMPDRTALIREGLEMAAKVADEHAANAWEIAKAEGQNDVCASGRNHGARAIAQAIRAIEVN